MNDTPELEDSLRKHRADLSLIKEGRPQGAIEVRKLPFVIGRAEGDLNVDDTSVSRKHCQIQCAEERWTVRDLNSSNGTFVNGEKIVERQIEDGDVIKIGHTEVKFSLRKRKGGGGGGRAGRDAIGSLIDDTALWNIVELSVGAMEARSWTKSYLETVLKQFDGDRGVVVLYDAVTGTTMPVAVVAIDWEGKEDPDKVPLSRSIVEEAITERKIVMTANAEIDPRFRDATSVAQYDIAGVICAPARWQGQPIGALYVERALSKQPFSEGESQQLQDMADLFGTAQMAWKGHSLGERQEWERERLGTIFGESLVEKLIGRGGASSVRRAAREVCVLVTDLAKVNELVASGNEEAWRMVSQFYAQIHEVIQQRGGAVMGPGCGIFGGFDDGSKDFYSDATFAGIEIQKLARPMVKRMGREMKLGVSVCVGIASGEALIGFFGSGRRVDYLGVGEVFPTAYGMAFQGENGEVLVEQGVFNKIRLHIKTHRMAPVMLPGARGLTQLYRLVTI